MIVSASSEACLFASARARSIFERSAEIISWAFLSASETAFCSSDIACRLTSFTASSEGTKEENESSISALTTISHCPSLFYYVAIQM